MQGNGKKPVVVFNCLHQVEAQWLVESKSFSVFSLTNGPFEMAFNNWIETIETHHISIWEKTLPEPQRWLEADSDAKLALSAN